jgi:hypothetical protein
MSNLTQDEINTLIASIDINDQQINEEIRRQRIGDSRRGSVRLPETVEKVRAKLVGRKLGTSPKKGKPTGKDAWNKGIAGPKLSDARKQRISETSKGRNTPYIYHSNKGTFTSMIDMFSAFADEYKPNRIKRWVADGKNGFSRTLK